MGVKITKKIRWAIIIAVACPALVLLFYFSGAFERAEWMAYDFLVHSMRSDKEAHEDVAVVMIDEASLQAMNPIVGRWPWPRSVYAELLEFIQMGEPAAVAFDILFTEDETYDICGMDSISDYMLAEATAMSGNVIHAQQILHDEEDEYNKDLLGDEMPPEFSEMFAIDGYADDASGEEANNYYHPLPMIAEASAGVGVVEFSADADGVFRRTRLVRRYQDDYYPVLGLAPVMQKLETNRLERTDDGVKIANTVIPVWPDGKYLINMYGKYNVYSISGLLASMQQMAEGDMENLMVDPSEFEGKIVYIGASAVGIEDLKHTPVQQDMPGVMLHASLASNILDGDFLRPASSWATVFFVFFLSAATALSVLLGRRSPVKVGIPLALMVAYYVFVSGSFDANILYELTPPISGMVLSYVGAFVYLSLTEGRERRRVRKMLGQYVSPHMLESLVDNQQGLLKAEVGSTEYVSILFSDIRGFTSISENEPPERIVSMLNRYFTLWSDAIFKHDGTIDKFVGDAVMALWGAPLIDEKHAEKAVKAALHLMEELPALNRELVAEGYPELKVGVGIHTGHAILGNIGSERKLDYTVIGDTVNLASRLEGLTKQYGCDILVSETTYNEIKGAFSCVYTDEVKVKGKEEAVKVYMVEGGKPND